MIRWRISPFCYSKDPRRTRLADPGGVDPGSKTGPREQPDTFLTGKKIPDPDPAVENHPGSGSDLTKFNQHFFLKI